MCCMMVYHPITAEPFTRDEFEDFHSKNRNGFGVIWKSPDGEIRHRRGLFTVNQQWQLYRSLLANGCYEMALHWRFATAGPTNLENCHPMHATKDILVMHNGVLHHRSTPTQSDTLCFIEDVLTPLLIDAPEMIHDKVSQLWLDQLIGAGNKLILWDRNAEDPTIIGEQKGLWYQGRWYSNTYAWTVPAEARRKLWEVY